MGSFFAGIKAGTLGGIVYIGGLAIFNVALLYALKADFFVWISGSTFSNACPLVPAANGTSAEGCLSLVVSLSVPFLAFVGFFIGLFFAGIFGQYYDSLPTENPTVKGEIVAYLLAATLVVSGAAGYPFDFEASVLTLAFLAAWTAPFGFILGRLYRRYTRPVQMGSQEPSLLRVLVDGRDCTGKSKTFALTSSHRLRAELTNDASFREWSVTGGLAVEDLRSFETVMEVNGEGSLLGVVTKKY